MKECTKILDFFSKLHTYAIQVNNWWNILCIFLGEKLHCLSSTITNKFTFSSIITTNIQRAGAEDRLCSD